jgi:hypothetical protein
VTLTGSGFQSGAEVVFVPTAGGAATNAPVQTLTSGSLDIMVPDVPAGQTAAGTRFGITVTNPDGSVSSVTNAFTMTAPAATDVNGGLSGSGTVNSLFIVDGNSFGDKASAPTSPSYPYSVDFRDSASNAIVASATVDFTGGDWENILVVGTVPGALSTSTTYKVTVTTPTGTTSALNFLVEGSVSFSPSTILWTATSGLPSAAQGFPAVVVPIGATSYLYALGGNTASNTTVNGKSSNVASVVYNQIDNTTGALVNASWTAATPLPASRGFASAVTANAFNSLISGNGNLYVLGGLDGTGSATSTVYFASLNADGSVPSVSTTGTWTATTPLPQALSATGAVIFHGRIYVAGGNDSTGTPVAHVYSSAIHSDGTLGPWQTQADMPVALAYHQLVTSAGFLYVLGGTTGIVDPITNVQSSASQGTVYYNRINIRNGDLATTWTTNSSGMGKNREKFTATVAGSYILLSGGLYTGSPGSSEQHYASINTDGSLSSFNGATGTHTISGSAGGYNFFNHASAFFVDGSGNSHVLIVGGEDAVTGTPVAGVWFQH